MKKKSVLGVLSSLVAVIRILEDGIDELVELGIDHNAPICKGYEKLIKDATELRERYLNK